MDYPILLQSTIKDIFEYNQDTGVFLRKSKSGVMEQTGTIRPKTKLTLIVIDGNSYHKLVLIWMYMTGEWREFRSISFDDGNKLNYKWKNIVEYDYERELISHKDLQDRLLYKERTGKFQWKSRKLRKCKVGCIRKRRGIKRMRITMDNKTYIAKRLIYFYMTGEWKFSRKVVCIDGNEMNLRWSNLKLLE